MKLEKVLFRWADKVRSVESLLDKKNNKLIFESTLSMVKFVKNRVYNVEDLKKGSSDKEDVEKLLEKFKYAARHFKEVMNDTIFSEYPSTSTDSSSAIYNLVCHLIEANEIVKAKDNKVELEARFKYGFLDVILRLGWFACNNLSKLLCRVYKDTKDQITNLYSISKYNGIIENNPEKFFTVFLGFKAELRAGIFRDILMNSADSHLSTKYYIDNLTVLSAYFAEVLAKNFLVRYAMNNRLPVPGHLSSKISDYYFTDLTKKYSYEVVEEKK